MFPLSDSIKIGRFPFITITLILSTIFVFIQQLLTPNPDGFVQRYALVPSSISFSNFTTFSPFITAIFLHGGFLHIITNMWFLWIFGDDVEGYFGHLFYFLLYIGSGIIGNAVQYMIAPTSTIPVLGASGAIAGILGAYFILFPYSKIKTLIIFFGFITIVSISAFYMLGYWFVLQLLSGATALPFTGTSGGVAFWAHVGGFVTGIIAAKLFPRQNILLPYSE